MEEYPLKIKGPRFLAQCRLCQLVAISAPWSSLTLWFTDSSIRSSKPRRTVNSKEGDFISSLLSLSLLISCKYLLLLRILVNRHFSLSVLNQLAVVFPKRSPYFDLAMEAYLCLSTYFFFAQWRESVVVYIDRQYIQPLRTECDDDHIKRLNKFASNLKKNKSHLNTDLQVHLLASNVM